MGRQIVRQQTNFTGGELDPKAAGRLDINAYYNGAFRLRNVIPIAHGGVTRRPGWRFLSELPGQTFKQSAGFGTESAPNGGTAANLNDGNEATTVNCTTELQSVDPYVVAAIDFGSDKAVLFVDVENMFLDAGGPAGDFYIQYSLNGSDWFNFGDGEELQELTTSGSDFIKARRWSKNTNGTTARHIRVARIGGDNQGTSKPRIGELSVWESTGITEDVRLVEFEFSISQTYIMAFTDQNVSIWRGDTYIASMRTSFTSDTLNLIDWTQSADTLIVVHGDIRPQLLTRQTIAEGLWTATGASFDYVPLHDFNPSKSNPVTDFTPNATDGRVKLTWDSGTNWNSGFVDQIIVANGGKCRITRYASSTVIWGDMLQPFLNTDKIESPNWTYIEGWEDAWSSSMGWPKSVTFHEGRLWFGGTNQLPNHFWGSQVDDFFNFDEGTALANEGISRSLDTDQLNEIVNLYSGRDFQIFTTGGEFYIVQGQNEPITPSNIAARRQTSRGSEPGIRVREASGGTQFVQRDGKSIREFIYSELDQAYGAQNISMLSSHLISSPVDFSLRRSTAAEEADWLLVTNQDGTLAVCATLREEEKTSWSLHSTPGGLIKRCAALNSGEVYAATRRTINGNDVLYLEMFDESCFMDCSYYEVLGSPQNTFSNLGFLEGETVSVRADGAILEDVTVTSGSVTISRNAEETIEIGIDPSDEVMIKTMPIEPRMAEGPVTGRLKRVVNTTVELYETSNVLVNGIEIPFRKTSDPLDSPPPVFTGRKEINGMLGYDQYGQVTITQNKPQPLTLLSLALEVSL